jgi:hypothetical protein
MDANMDTFPGMNNAMNVQPGQHPQQHPQQQPHQHQQPNMMSGQVGYDTNGDGYASHQGSVSPFAHSLSHSPHQSTTNFEYFPQSAMQ